LPRGQVRQGEDTGGGQPEGLPLLLALGRQAGLLGNWPPD